MGENNNIKVLFIGDIFGKPGRKAISKYLPELRTKYSIDLVIANAENSAHGKGITSKILNSLYSSGIDFCTLGNHTWSKKNELDYIFKSYPNLIRPMNLSPLHRYHNLGEGSKIINIKNVPIRITNLLGNSIYLKNTQLNCFQFFNSFLLELIQNKSPEKLHIVDFHSETTSEKNAFLWTFDGQVSAILCTHTHVPTNDYIITENNTAYISDVGMTGPSTGIIGGAKKSIIDKFFNPSHQFKLEPELGPIQFCSVLLIFNQSENIPISIEPIIFREGFKVDKYGVQKI